MSCLDGVGICTGGRFCVLVSSPLLVAVCVAAVFVEDVVTVFCPKVPFCEIKASTCLGVTVLSIVLVTDIFE